MPRGLDTRQVSSAIRHTNYSSQMSLAVGSWLHLADQQAHSWQGIKAALTDCSSGSTGHRCSPITSVQFTDSSECKHLLRLQATATSAASHAMLMQASKRPGSADRPLSTSRAHAHHGMHAPTQCTQSGPAAQQLLTSPSSQHSKPSPESQLSMQNGYELCTAPRST